MFYIFHYLDIDFSFVPDDYHASIALSSFSIMILRLREWEALMFWALRSFLYKNNVAQMQVYFAPLFPSDKTLPDSRE